MSNVPLYIAHVLYINHPLESFYLLSKTASKKCCLDFKNVNIHRERKMFSIVI